MKIFLHLIILCLAIVSVAYSSEIIEQTKTVVIDPGFGGENKGAESCKSNIYSKDINLEISKKLKRKLENLSNVKVILTRDNDSAVSLERRVRLANINNADLFISIQTNASPNPSSYGIESYFFNFERDPNSIEVEVTTNTPLQKEIEDREIILSALIKSQNKRIEKSKLLAELIQTEICNQLEKNYKNINNRGVKQAPFYVLVGTRMPSVMIQTSFISNKRECNRLLSDKYQIDICDGIIKGIKNFIEGNASHNNSLAGDG